MEMVTVECPKCKGSLHVDQDADKIFCLYCRTEVQVKKPETSGGAIAEALIKRGFLAIEFGDWNKAYEVLDEASNLDPENARIYFGKLHIGTLSKTEEELVNANRPLSDYADYEKVMRFGDTDLKQRLELYNKKIVARFEKHEKERLEKERLAEEKVAKLEEEKRLKKELDTQAAQQYGCLMPILISLPLAVVIAEIWFFIFWGGLQIVSGAFFENIGNYGVALSLGVNWITYVGLFIAWFFALAIINEIYLNNARKKIERENQK